MKEKYFSYQKKKRGKMNTPITYIVIWTGKFININLFTTDTALV